MPLQWRMIRSDEAMPNVLLHKRLPRRRRSTNRSRRGRSKSKGRGRRRRRKGHQEEEEEEANERRRNGGRMKDLRQGLCVLKS